MLSNKIPTVKDGKRVLSNYVIFVYRPARNNYNAETKKINKLDTDIMMINDIRGKELTPESISDIYLKRKEIPGLSRIVTQSEILANDYNLNISLYLHQERDDEISYQELLNEIRLLEQEQKKVQSQLETALNIYFKQT